MENFHAVGGVSTQLCADFLSHYTRLFNVDNSEVILSNAFYSLLTIPHFQVEKEKRMLEVLEKINFPTPTSMKRSGDIRMWIYIESRTSGNPVSLVLHPSLSAAEALRVAGGEANISEERLNTMYVHEVVLGGSLERPLHHSEKLLDVTLRWGRWVERGKTSSQFQLILPSWPETDRHDNYLLLKTNQFYQEVSPHVFNPLLPLLLLLQALPCALPPLSVFAEVQFSDCRGPKSKFLPFLFSVAKANIIHYREEKTGIPTELGAWPVEEVGDANLQILPSRYPFLR